MEVSLEEESAAWAGPAVSLFLVLFILVLVSEELSADCEESASAVFFDFFFLVEVSLESAV